MRVAQRLRLGYIGTAALAICISACAYLAIYNVDRQRERVLGQTLPLMLESADLNRQAVAMVAAAWELRSLEPGPEFIAALLKLRKAKTDLTAQLDRTDMAIEGEILNDLRSQVTDLSAQADRILALARNQAPLISELRDKADRFARAVESITSEARIATSWLDADSRALAQAYRIDGAASEVRTTAQSLLFPQSTVDPDRLAEALSRDMIRLRAAVAEAPPEVNIPLMNAQLDAISAVLEDGAILESLREAGRLDAALADRLIGLSNGVVAVQSTIRTLSETLQQQVISTEQNLLVQQQAWIATILGVLFVLLVLTGLIIYFIVDRGVARRLELVYDRVLDIEGGRLDQKADIDGNDEITVIGKALERLRRFSINRNQIERDLQNARVAAEDTAAAKSEFLAMMSHELRTPINAISGMFELIERADIPERQKRRARKGREAASQLHERLSKVLDASRIEARAIDPSIRPMQIAPLISEIEELAHVSVAKSGRDVTVTIHDETTRPAVSTDGLLVRQVLGNLVDNAARFTRQGTIEIVFSDLSPLGGLAVSVRDTGIGVPPEQEKDLFVPFRQLDRGFDRQTGGTGLGLSISKKLAILLKGDLSFLAIPSGGSEFRLTVPDLTSKEAASHENPAC